MKFHSVTTKLLLMMAVFLLVGFAIVVGMNAMHTSAVAKESALTEVKQYAELQGAKVGNFLYGPYNGVLALASSLGMLPGNSGVAQPRMFSSEQVRQTLLRYPAAQGVFVEWEPNILDGLDEQYVGRPGGDEDNGSAGAYWIRGEGGKETVIWGSTGVDAEPYYTEPKAAGKPVLIDPYVDNDTGVLMVTISVPVMQQGRFVGVAGVDLRLDTLRDLAASVHPFETGYMTIYANDGSVLGGPENLELAKPDPTLPADAREAVASGREMQYYDGPWLHLIRPVKIEGIDKTWAIRISASSDVVYAASNAATMRAAVTSILAALIVLAIVGWFVRQQMRPLVHLSGTFAELASGRGDLTRQLEQGNGKDEISALAVSFNRFSQSLRKMLLDVRDRTERLNHSASELDQETDAISQHVAQQAQSSLTTASSVHQLFTSISRVAESSGHASEITRASSSAVDKVAEDVQGAAREISEIATAISRVDGVLTKLSERSEEIGSIVQTIKDIAEQTNLLALNAAIEAARAGEQGRGFAVVADEVRKLAERTATSTVEIGDSIAQVQTETRAASASMEQAVEQVKVGVQFAERAAESVNVIRSANDEVLEVINHTAQATAEQSEASQIISDAVEGINEMSSHTEQSLGRARDNIVGLRALADQLHGMLAQFKL